MELLRGIVAVALSVLAGLMALACLGAAVGLWPWIELSARIGASPLPQAGMLAQLGMTLILLAACLNLPSSRRIARVEQGQHSFAIGLEDVATAYARAHAADRQGAFALSGEFDAVKERFEHLTRHPDLAHLEPEILELAAKMSHVSRRLAQTYAEEKVARARRFLAERQEEVLAVNERLATARRICDDLRRWLTDVETEERQAFAQVDRLEADLREILPGLGYILDEGPVPLPDNVVSLHPMQPERP